MPHRYLTTRPTPKRWTEFEKQQLESLRESGMDWPEIAKRVQHPQESCKATLSYIRRDRKRAAAALEPKKPHFTGYVPEPINYITTPTGKVVRTATLMQDAELRARIAIQGPNGLFGDPLPGRSALDQQRGANACHAGARSTLTAVPSAPLTASEAISQGMRDKLFMQRATQKKELAR